jgi:hypothetical protein
MRVDTASCHCARFTYTVTCPAPSTVDVTGTYPSPLSSPSRKQLLTRLECNCSICVRNGYLFVYVPDARVSFTKGAFEELRVRSPA